MTDDVQQVVAQFLRQWRAGQQLSQQNMASLLGWSREALSTKERGLRGFTLVDLEQICFLTESTLADILMVAPRGRTAIERLGL